VVDEVGDGGLGVREPLDDPQPVHVRQGLVERAQCAELLRLVEDGRDRAANAGSGGGQGSAPFRVRGQDVASTTVYINLR
jgi:hypothetical protein